MGYVSNAIGWLTVAIAVGIVSLQVADLLSVGSIAKQPPASNEPLIDVTSAVTLPPGREGIVFIAPEIRE